ncbi:PDR/VanB family oxidoreductase [Amorphus orientalis]|uniref:Vanillate O-demethylase ferredoxin subunit n=1 Tax=Amorphus orientalis TaxID=649198 RepID=A0AAE3VKN5_9HYPH|nr:PDR/VanB family oxidoreductase [Amorphus orientalis]MDQ0313698.1 vanillate O-demethylase ferredoxin subunit [Amorphus orientalis]
MKGRLDWRDAKVVRAETIAADIRQIEFDVAGGVPAFQPGSHVTVSVALDHGRAERSYSCLPAPAGRIRIAVKRHEASRGGSRYMWRLAEGDEVRLSLPENRFELSWQTRDYLLVAGGIGITPILGMAEALAERDARVRLLYGVHRRDQLAFDRDVKASLGARAEIFVAEDGGRIDLASAIDELAADGELYICGPLPMLQEAKALWADRGRPSSRLRYEVFGDSGAEPERPFQVRILNMDITVGVRPDQSLLDALDAAGVEMISDCRRGECGLCSVGIVDLNGRIDHRDVFFSEEEKQANTAMCACVSRLAEGEAVIDIGYRG